MANPERATLENRLDVFVAQRRFQTSLLIGFSGIALLMADIGIYGLMQYSIATRTREIGMLLGLVGAWWLRRAGSSLLFGVSATDPFTFMTVSLLLTAVSTAACYFPARCAMRVEPIVALRQE